MFLHMIIHPGLADFREKHLVRFGIASKVGDKLPSMLWYFRMSVLLSARLLTTGYFARIIESGVLQTHYDCPCESGISSHR